MTTALAFVAMAVGLLLMLRSVAMIATGATGRFPLDASVSFVGGCALVLLGRTALDLIG